jgi:hypothetical protein
MDHAEIANLAGVLPGDLDSLMAGRATKLLATKVGVTMADIEDFIAGKPSKAMAAILGFSAIAPAQELAQTLGRNGSIGMIIGVLISRP